MFLTRSMSVGTTHFLNHTFPLFLLKGIHYVIGIILCGGAGSRLWPSSRELFPKPFLPLTDGESLLQKTFLRASAIPGMTEVLTVTNRQLLFLAMEEVRRANVSASFRHILEPFGRNTAPAIAAAALEVEKTRGRDECMMVLAADHLILNQAAFIEATVKARELAAADKLVVFGIKPTAPEIGYGYIESDNGAVLRFCEKPDAETARAFVDSGRFFWNSGMFCFKVDTLLAEFERHAPDVLAAVARCVDKSRRIFQDGHLELNRELFADVPDISIDYALMEKSDRIAMIPCDIGWSDVGSWDAWNSLLPADADANRVREPANALLRDTHNCDINNGSRLVATLGVRDLLIVDTTDAVLIADKSRAAEVKHIYNELKANNNPAHKNHDIVYCPWGSYMILLETPTYKMKQLVVKRGEAISLQSHTRRNEHWVVVGGEAEVTRNDDVFTLRLNESAYIKAGDKHRVANRGGADLVIIEVQTGTYLGEDDIVRFEDRYERMA